MDQQHQPLDQSGISWPVTDLYTGPERRKLAREREPRFLFIFFRRLWSLFAYSDTTPLRFMLACCAGGWAFGLLIPGDSLSRDAYLYFSLLFGSHADEKFAVLWGTFALLSFWRVFSAVPRPNVSLSINVFGAMLFASVPIEIYVVRPVPFPIGIVHYVVAACAASWVAVRTSINSGRGWRAD